MKSSCVSQFGLIVYYVFPSCGYHGRFVQIAASRHAHCPTADSTCPFNTPRPQTGGHQNLLLLEWEIGMSPATQSNPTMHQQQQPSQGQHAAPTAVAPGAIALPLHTEPSHSSLASYTDSSKYEPIWLQSRISIPIALAFVGFAIASEVLYFYSKHHHGIILSTRHLMRYTHLWDSGFELDFGNLPQSRVSQFFKVS